VQYGEGWQRALQAFEAGHGVDAELQGHDVRGNGVWGHNVVPRVLRMAEHALVGGSPAQEVRLDDVLALAGGEGGAWAHRVLGVPLGADDAAIRRAFRKLSLAMHPDRNPDDRERATAAQETLNLAYHALAGAAEGATEGAGVAVGGVAAEGPRVRTLASDIVAWASRIRCEVKCQALWDAEPPLSPLQCALLRSVVKADGLVLGERAGCLDDVVVAVACRVAHPCGGEPLALRVPFGHVFAVVDVLPQRKGQQRPLFPALARAAAAYVREDVDGWARRAAFVGDARFREVWARSGGVRRLADALCAREVERIDELQRTLAAYEAAHREEGGRAELHRELVEGYESDIRHVQLRVASIRTDPFAEVCLDDSEVMVAKNRELLERWMQAA
jgi:hypothetical protein